MPAPTAIVWFVDADGDELPYVVGEGYDEACEHVARALLARDIAEGKAWPALPVTVDRIERDTRLDDPVCEACGGAVADLAAFVHRGLALCEGCAAIAGALVAGGDAVAALGYSSARVQMVRDALVRAVCP